MESKLCKNMHGVYYNSIRKVDRTGICDWLQINFKECDQANDYNGTYSDLC